MHISIQEKPILDARVRRDKAIIPVKFDGDRANGKIYTVDVDGNGDDGLHFRWETWSIPLCIPMDDGHP